MNANWFILFVRALDKDGKPLALPSFPQVGHKVQHFLGKSEEDEQQKKDKENVLWTRIQDDVRPAWSPDILRMGFAVLFKREGLPKLAVKMGLRNPEKMKKEKGGVSHTAPNGNRVLTFDDVWVVAAEPVHRPFFMPSYKLTDEQWWLEAAQLGQLTDPYIAPGGADVMVGAQRMADVVSQMLATPEGYPRNVPSEMEPDDYSEFVNPLIPVNLRVRQDVTNIDDTGGGSGRSDYFAGLELFRY